MKKSNLLKLLLLTCAAFLTGCNTNEENGGQTGGDPSQEVDEVKLILGTNTLSLVENQTFNLSARLSNGAKTSLEWTSSSSAVTVEEGLITANSVGNAVVTARDKNLNISASCEVTVTASNIYPTLDFSSPNVKILLGDNNSVSLIVKYNGKNVSTGYTVEVSTSNDNVTAVHNAGVIKVDALKLGKSYITASVTYKNKTVTKSFEVNVVEDVSFKLNETAKTLYTYAYDGNHPSTFTLNATVVENNQSVNEPVVEWKSDDETVATVSNGVINTVNVGEATISATYTSVNGQKYTTNCIVTVEKTVIDLNKNIDLYVSESDGAQSFSLSDLGLTEISDFDIYEGESEVEFTNASGVITPALTAGLHKVTLNDDNIKASFGFDIMVITKTISSFAEFKSVRDANTVGGVWDGCFILKDNIIVDSGNYSSTVSEFNGVFDGRGYTVSGGTFHAGAHDKTKSLFGENKGMVINTAFVNIKVGILAGIMYSNNGIIDNCLFDVAPIGDYANCSAFYSNRGTINNSIFYDAVDESPTNDSGAISYLISGTFDNVLMFAGKICKTQGCSTTGITLYAPTAALPSGLTGFNEYWKLTGTKAEFNTTREMKDNQILSIAHDQVDLTNGDSYTLPTIPSFATMEVVDLDSAYQDFVSIKSGVLKIADTISSDFTFGIKITANYDSTVTVTIPFVISNTIVVNKTIDLFKDSNDGDMIINAVSDLGVSALSTVTATYDNGTSLAVTVNGNDIDFSNMPFGEHSVILVNGNTKIKFNVVVITKAIGNYTDFVAARDANTVDGVWSGYFILKGDVTMDQNTAYSSSVTSFTGVFDGRGYKFADGYFHSGPDDATKSLFANCSGTVKNTAFMNMKLGIIAGPFRGCTGLIDNCLFEGFVIDGNYANCCFIYSQSGHISNSMFYLVCPTNANNKGVISMWQGTTENVLVFASKDTGWDNRSSKTGMTRYDYDAPLPENLSGYNSYWDLSGTKAALSHK